MFQTNNVATLTDRKGRNDIEVEVNKAGKVEDYVEFRVKDGNGNWIKSYVEIQKLYALIFMIVDDEKQQEMMPIRKTQIRIYERQHRIQLKKNMKKGEIVVANCKIDVPLVIEEGLRGLIGKRKISSGILTPR